MQLLPDLLRVGVVGNFIHLKKKSLLTFVRATAVCPLFMDLLTLFSFLTDSNITIY